MNYTHAQRVFNHFNIKDLRDYHNFHLLTDVHLLTDMFDNFRYVCLQHLGFHPAHNYTSPGLFWEAGLKMKGLELYLLTDIDQHLFIEEGSKGRVLMINHHCTEVDAPDIKN